MKKTMKRMFSLIVLCFSLFCLLQIRNVEAALGDKAGEAKSDYAVAISDLQKTELVGGVKLYKQAIKSLYNGITDKTNKKYAWNNHTVQWVDLPASTENVNVVVWTKGTDNGWASATVRTTAKFLMLPVVNTRSEIEANNVVTVVMIERDIVPPIDLLRISLKSLV